MKKINSNLEGMKKLHWKLSKRKRYLDIHL